MFLDIVYTCMFLRCEDFSKVAFQSLCFIYHSASVAPIKGFVEFALWLFARLDSLEKLNDVGD